MYSLTHNAYCGMRLTITAAEPERATVRTLAATRLRRMRRLGFPVVIVERGSRWEVCEPAGAVMVPDACGVLRIDRQTFECRECGTEHETAEERNACCDFWSEWTADDDGADHETA